MKQCVGLFLSLSMCVVSAGQPEKGVDKRSHKEYCALLHVFENLIGVLDKRHAEERESLKAATRKEFSDYMRSQNRELTDEQAMQVLATFKKNGAREEEKLRAKQKQKKQERIRDFVNNYYPDMDKENLEDFCLV